MSQRPVSYAGKRIAPSRRSAPPRKAPSRPAPRPDRTKSAAAPVPGVRRRMVQLVISAALLLAVIAMKFLFPAALDRCRATLLDLLGADTDFVEVFSAAGRAFADGSTVSDALNDAYTAVFGTSEIPAAPAVSRSETLPDNVEMLSGSWTSTTLTRSRRVRSPRCSAAAATPWRAAAASTTAWTSRGRRARSSAPLPTER